MPFQCLKGNKTSVPRKVCKKILVVYFVYIAIAKNIRSRYKIKVFKKIIWNKITPTAVVLLRCKSSITSRRNLKIIFRCVLEMQTEAIKRPIYRDAA